jgi:hypothetical protein
MAQDESSRSEPDPAAEAGADGTRSATVQAGTPVRTDGGSAGASEDESGGSGEGGSGGDEDASETGAEGALPDEVDRALIRSLAADLKRPDVRLLSAIRDINAMPENYPDGQTQGGEVPATSTAIRDAAGLTDEQVKYRLRPGERGLEQMGPDGLVDLKAPPYRSNKAYGPRSAELTEVGKMVLAEAEGDEDIGDVSPVRTGPVSRDEFDALAERVEAWEDDEFGAVDPDMASDIRSLFREMVKFYQAFEALGIDAQRVFSGEELTASNQEEIAEALTTTLLERAAEREDVSLGGGAGGTPETSGSDDDGGPAGGASGGSGNAEAAAPGSQERGDESDGGGSGGAADGDSRGLDEFGDGGDGR